MNPCRPLFAALLLLASAASAQQPAASPHQATPPAPTYRVDVRLVNVFVNVTDSSGAPVGGLQQSDFAITEDGHPERIALFERQSELPLSIVLAIDTSGSVRKDLALEQQAAHEFVHTLLRPVDHLSLMTFADTVREVVPFTSNLRKIDSGLNDLRGGMSTALYNAVYIASDRLLDRAGRKIIVLITDGGDTAKDLDYGTARDQAIRAEAMLYTIIDVPVASSAGRDTGGEHALIQLSIDTGGKYYYAENPAQLQAIFRRISEDLRTQYLLGYYPAAVSGPPGDSFRAIDVQLRDQAVARNYTLRHRAGYYPSSNSGQ